MAGFPDAGGGAIDQTRFFVQQSDALWIGAKVWNPERMNMIWAGKGCGLRKGVASLP